MKKSELRQLIKEELDKLGEGKKPINLKSKHLSSEEYQKAKKLKDFNAKDWKWDPKKGLYVNQKN